MADFYVATTGNDTTGDGSVGNPWATHAKAVSEVVEDTTIHSAAGTYDESAAPIVILSKPTITFSPTGEVDVQVADHADGGVNIDNSSVAFLGDVTNRYKFYVVGAAGAYDVINMSYAGETADRTFAADYLEVSGGGRDGFSATGNTYTITSNLRNCKFYSNAEDGVTSHASTITYMTDCECYDNGSGSSPSAGAVWYGRRNLYHDNDAGSARKCNFAIYGGATGYEQDSKFYGSGMDRHFLVGCSAGIGTQDFSFIRPLVYGTSEHWLDMRSAIDKQIVRFVGGTFGGTLTGEGMTDDTTSRNVTVLCESCVFTTSAVGKMIVAARGISGQAARWSFTNCVLTATNASSDGIWAGGTSIAGYMTIVNCVITVGSGTGTWGITGENYDSASGNNIVWGKIPFKANAVAQATDIALLSDSQPLPQIAADYFPEPGGHADIGTGSISARSIGEYDLYGRPKLDYSDSRGAVYPQHNTGMMLPMQMYPADNTSMAGVLVGAGLLEAEVSRSIPHLFHQQVL